MENEPQPQSKTIQTVLMVLTLVLIALGLIRLGMGLGYRQARFVGAFGDNFERNLVGPRGGGRTMLFGMMGPFGNGAVGDIVSINYPQLVVSGSDGLEKTVLVSTSTVIHQFRGNISTSTLRVGQRVIILGSPNDKGQIEAKLLRVMPFISQ